MHVPAFYRYDAGSDAKLVHPGKARVHLHAGHNSNVARPENAFSLRLSGPTEPFSIGGFDGNIDGHTLRIYNSTPHAMTIVNRDPQTNEYYQIDTLTVGDVTFPGPGIVLFEYDALSRAWMLATPVPRSIAVATVGEAAMPADVAHMLQELAHVVHATNQSFERRLSNVELFISRVQSQLT